MKKITAVILILFISITNSKSQTESLYKLFEYTVFDNLHVYMPNTPSQGFHRFDPFPFKGAEMNTEDKSSFCKMFNIENDEYTLYYAVMYFNITPDIFGYIVRRGSETQFFDSSIDLYVYDNKKQKADTAYSLSFCQHGESGGGFGQSRLTDINGDGCIDIITRHRSGTWEEVEEGKNDYVEVNLWENGSFKKEKPKSQNDFLKTFAYYNEAPYLQYKTDDKNKQYYSVTVSKHKTKKDAEIASLRFTSEFKYDKIIRYNLFDNHSIIKEKDGLFYVVAEEFKSKNEAELIQSEIKSLFKDAEIVKSSFFKEK